MVCPRCIAAVEKALEEFEIPYKEVTLGQVILPNEISSEKEEAFSKELEALGFELLSSAKGKLISEIKSVIIQQIHHSKEPLTVNFSEYLSEQLGAEYDYMSRLFSSVEGITINRFIVVQKIEKVKELLFYNELSSAEIADQLNYNSVAYLSSLFKKETGMTLTEFKEVHKPSRKGIDQV